MVQTHTNIVPQILSLAHEIGRDLLKTFPVAAFLYVHVLPVPALMHASIFPATHLYIPSSAFASHAPASIPVRMGTVLGVTTTAYSSTEAQTDSDPFTTASGTRVRTGVAAANFLPLGTKIRLNGRIYTIEDRMNARYNNSYRVDVWMNSTAKAQQHGVQDAYIQIVSLP